MNFWNPFQQYACMTGPNGQFLGYYPVPFSPIPQMGQVPSKTNPISMDGTSPHPMAKQEELSNCVKTEPQPVQSSKMGKMVAREKKQQVKEIRVPDSTRNTKANILKDFVKSLKKDATQLLLAKQVYGFDYSIKKFTQMLSETLPKNDKYIRIKSVVQLCRNHPDKQFRILLRVTLRNFLKGQYRNFVLLKRKCRFEYLKATRQIYNMLIGNKSCDSDHE